MNSRHQPSTAAADPKSGSRQQLNAPGPTATQPLHWREIVMRGSAADLPFGSYFAELAIAGLAAHASKAGQENAMKLEEQFIGSPCLEAAYWPLPNDRCWGEDTRLIEAWFDEGEELEFSERDLLIDEPDRWERALHWVRSLAVATGIIPA